MATENVEAVPRSKRRVVYSLSLNADEFEALSAKAAKMGLKLGTFIKMAATQYEVP